MEHSRSLLEREVCPLAQGLGTAKVFDVVGLEFLFLSSLSTKNLCLSLKALNDKPSDCLERLLDDFGDASIVEYGRP